MRQTSRKIAVSISIFVTTSFLSGCFELGDPVDTDPSALSGAGSVNPTAATANTIPTISGNPSNVASVGTNWSFTPNAADADGDVLIFVISNQPNWTSFDSSTGRLAGVPLSWPVDELNTAQFGLFAIEKDMLSPSASFAVGENEYICPTIADVGAVPEMVGAVFVLLLLTSIEKLVRFAVDVPSDTVI